MEYPSTLVENAVNELSRLPGVGKRSALRFALYLLKQPNQTTENLCNSLSKMKAEIKPRIELENRTKLETVIPLSTPFVIFVDPADSCNFKCSFCPTGDTELMKKVGRPFKVMNFELYKKIIDDICEFDKPIKVLRLYKDGLCL